MTLWMNPGCRSKSPWAPSGHLANFDRRKCKGPLNGPTATGQQCPEGWTLYPEPFEFTNHRGHFFGQPLRVISGEPPVPFLGFDDVNGMY